MIDIQSEWLSRSYSSLTTEDRHRLGLGRRAALMGDAQVAKVRARIDHHLFVPDDDGLPMVVGPVFGHPAFEGGEVVDLVAWEVTGPGRWYLRAGLADALGEWHAMAGADPVDVRVHRRPIDWLRADGDGLCLLSDDAVTNAAILTALPGIIAEDMTHRDELARLLRMPYRLPTVRVAPATNMVRAA